MIWSVSYTAPYIPFNWFWIGSASFQLVLFISIVTQHNGINSACAYASLLLLLIFRFCFIVERIVFASHLNDSHFLLNGLDRQQKTQTHTHTQHKMYIWINGHVKHHKRMFDNTLSWINFYKHINYAAYHLHVILYTLCFLHCCRCLVYNVSAIICESSS